MVVMTYNGKSRTTQPRGLTPMDLRAIRRLVGLGHRPTAIKIYRGATGADQAEAETFVNAVERSPTGVEQATA